MEEHEVSVRRYCIDVCPIGKAKTTEFLEKNNSVFDAVTDMNIFVDHCKKTCPKMRALELNKELER